jgi:hypothetical protein
VASVDWSEESNEVGDPPPTEALDRVSELLTTQNWNLADRLTRPTNVAVGGSRELYTLWVDARPLRLTVLGQSPLYRAPAEPNSSYVVEPR